MTEKKLYFEIELCGYRGKIRDISGLGSLDRLYVWVEFDEPRPESINATSVPIPAKDYSREELLAAIKKEGEKQLSEILASRRKENEECRRREEAQERINTLAKRMEKLLKG